MAQPVLSPLGERLRERTAPLAPDDEAHGWAHAHLCEALMAGLLEVQQIYDPADPLLPGEPLLDPASCPDWALPWLAQLVGVYLPPGSTPAQQRALISGVSGWHRGTPAALRNAAQMLLSGTRHVDFRERLGGDPYALEVVTRASEVPPSDRGDPTNLVTNPSSELSASFGQNSTTGTTPINLLANPSGETGVTTIVAQSSSSAGQPASSLVDTTGWAKAGTHASRFTLTRTDANPVVARSAPIGAAGVPVTALNWYAFRFTAHLQALTGGPAALNRVQAAIYWYTAAGSAGSPTFTVGPIGSPLAVGDAQDCWGIVQAPAGAAFGSPTAYIVPLDNAGAPQTITLDLDAFCLVDLGTATPPSNGQTTELADMPPYFDGDMPGWAWTGTAHASTTKPTSTRTRTQDWAASGTWSTRYTTARDDGASLTLRTDLATDQGTSGRFAVTPGRFYAARIRVRQRPTSGLVDYAYLQFTWYQADNSTLSATPQTQGPRAFPQPSEEADLVQILKPPADARWVSIRALWKVHAGWQVLDADADAVGLFDIGSSFTGPTGTNTRPEDVPAYFDGDTPGHFWSGTAHKSTARTNVTNLVLDALTAAKPGGLVLTYRTVEGWDYAAMTDAGGNYTALKAAYATYTLLAGGPPL